MGVAYNRLVVAGYLVRDLEEKFTPTGLAVGKSAIAVNSKYKEKESTMFIDVTFFGKTAETACKYLHKGSAVLLEGELKQNVWENNEGQKRSKHEMLVQKMVFLDSKGSAGPTEESSEAENPF